MAFDRGYISPYFVTNPERMEAVIEDPYILITDKKLSAVNDILPWLERQLQVSKNLVLIAEDVDGEALATLAVNKLRGTINVVAVKAPGLRRPPQGEPRRHRRADRRQLISEGAQPRPRHRAADGPGPRPPHRRHEGRDDHHRGQGHEEGHRRPHDPDQRRARRPTSDWDREKLAGAPRQARRLRRRHQGRRRHRGRAQGEASTASRTPSARPAPPSKRASSPAVGSPC